MSFIPINLWKKGQEEYPHLVLDDTRLLEGKAIEKSVVFSNSLNFSNNSDSFDEAKEDLRSILLRIIFAHIHKLKVYIPNLGDGQGSIIQREVSFMSRNFNILGIQNTNRKGVIIDPREFVAYDWKNSVSKVGYTGLTTNGVNLYCAHGELEFLKALLMTQIVDYDHDKVNINFNKIKAGVATPQVYNFKTIETDNINFKKNLISSKKFELLDNREHFLLDLPFIMWRLGWYKGGITLANWIYAKGTEVNSSLKFDFNWFNGFDRVNDKINEGLNTLNEAEDLEELFDTDTYSFENNYNTLIKKIKTLKINEKVIYGHFGAPTDLTGGVLSNVLRTYTVGDFIATDNDELEAACGRFRLSFYGKFELNRVSREKCDVKMFNFGYRLGDNFDFPENQTLGHWKYLILNPERPSKIWASGEEVTFTDTVFRNFFNKLYPNNKAVLSPNTKAYRNNNDFLTYCDFEFENDQPVNFKTFEFEYD
jgi:hypothetical protein